ncbi:repeat protein [Moumouvirus goulette]|uniref:Repeat protein n=1 Tax=Moumouvirus goulette TaxID=1247379 RepID=M1PFT9_9VIRU|nr:repeat protein [Moumouvirus goulette]AGF84863.1 repeat protein [Moumouvirus goulette]
MSSKLYFKITNETECHHGFQYVDGLNILQEEFNNNPEDSCVKGRLYFSKPKHICKYLHYGTYLREVYLPTNNPDFKMIKDPEGDKYGTNMIVLGERRDLRDADIWDYMVLVGINIHVDHDYPLFWASKGGHLEVVKYLVENGANIHGFSNPLKNASEEGHLEVVKYLVEHQSDMYLYYDYALRSASKEGHLEIVKYLVENGANIHANNDWALRSASKEGHLEVVKILVKCGADIHADDDEALKNACIYGHFKVVQYLIEHGTINDKNIFILLTYALNFERLDVAKYLFELVKYLIKYRQTFTTKI